MLRYSLNVSLFTCFSIFSLIGHPIATVEAAQDTSVTVEDIPKNAWPSQWFAGPSSASKLRLNEFKQSPILDELVKNGELPPIR